MRKGSTASWVGDHSQTTLWQIDKNLKSETGHGTQKPVECVPYTAVHASAGKSSSGTRRRALTSSSRMGCFTSARSRRWKIRCARSRRTLTVRLRDSHQTGSIVVGRPIIRAGDKLAAAHGIRAETQTALALSWDPARGSSPPLVGPRSRFLVSARRLLVVPSLLLSTARGFSSPLVDYSWFPVSSRRLLAVPRLFLASTSCRIDTLDVSNFLLFRRV